MKRLAIIALLAGAAQAAQASDAPVGLSGMNVLQTVVGLLLVLAMIGAAAWMMRRLGQPAAGRERLISLVASTALGPRERAVIIEIEKQWLVLGVTANQVTLLHSMPGVARAEDPPQQGFGALLDRALKRAPASVRRAPS